MSDKIKHPSHYAEGREFEPKDVIRDWELNFNLGSAVKYIARAGRKDDIVQDLKKAQEFIQFEIDAIEAERNKEVKPKGKVTPVFTEFGEGKHGSYGMITIPDDIPKEHIKDWLLKAIMEVVEDADN